MKKQQLEDVWVDVVKTVYLQMTARSVVTRTAIVTAIQAADDLLAAMRDRVDVEKRKQRKEHLAPKTLSPEGEALLAMFEERFPRLEPVPKPLDVALITRLNEAAKQGEERWKKRFDQVGRSEFLMGKSSKFQATLAWLLQPRVQVEIDCGKYV